MRNLLHGASLLAAIASAISLAGCDKLKMSETPDRSSQRIELPHRTDDDEESEVTPVAVDSVPEPQPEPEVQLPPIVLPPPLPGEVAECVVDGVIFRATECYRTTRGLRLTVYCGSNETDATILFQPAQCQARGEPSQEQAGMVILPGPHVSQRIALPRGQVIGFQMEPTFPGHDTSIATATIAFDSRSTIDGYVEFVGLPVSEEMPVVPLEESLQVPERLKRMLEMHPSPHTTWQFEDFVGDTVLEIELFDSVTGAIAGSFHDVDDRVLTKQFEGHLAADGLSFEVTTIRGSGINSSGTTEISNTNLYLQQQQTHVTFQLVRCDLIGISQDGVKFGARLAPSLAYP